MEMIKLFLPDYDEIKKCLSSERLSSYESIATLTPLLDIALYNAIQLQSSLLFLPLQYLEITLRNKINNALRSFYSNLSSKITLPGAAEEWYTWMPSSLITINNVKEAIKKAKREIRGRKINSNDIISRLHFGIWQHILQEKADNRDPLHFWRGTVHEIFPCSVFKKETILQALRNITNIRNRLFHHEPLWKNHKHCTNVEDALNEIESKYMLIIDFIGWMSSPLKDYMNAYTSIFKTFLKINHFMHVEMSEFINQEEALSFLWKNANKGK